MASETDNLIRSGLEAAFKAEVGNQYSSLVSAIVSARGDSGEEDLAVERFKRGMAICKTAYERASAAVAGESLV